MSDASAAMSVGTGSGAYRYQRHQSEQTLLYRIVEQYSPEFTAHLVEQGTVLSGYVLREFEDYLTRFSYNSTGIALIPPPHSCQNK